MKASDIPAKFALAFGANATAGFIRSIPTTSGDPAAASLSLGFPPNTATPVGAGGTPPNVQDFNGILNQTSAWDQWAAAGGAFPPYDGTFQTSISGYPKGAIVASAVTAGAYWLSTADDNVTNPDAAGAGWTGFQLPPVNQTGSPTTGHFAVWAAPYSIQDGGVVGSMSHQNSSAVAITGGNVSGLTTCAIVSGTSNAGFSVTCPSPLVTLQDSNTSNAWVIQQNGANAQMTLSFNALGVGVFDHISGTYTATSDARLKRDVADLAPVLDRIARLRPVTFSYIADEDKRTHIGLLAQDLQVEFPELVSEISHGLSDEIRLGVNYANLSVVALRAIQELRAEVAQLRKDAGLS